jgi:hypothetical protein
MRGQATILSGEGEIHVLYNNRALAEAEKMLGRGILTALSGFSKGEFSVGDAAILLQVGMEHDRRAARVGGRRVTIDDAYKLMDECGLMTVVKPIFEAIAEVLNYDGGSDENTAKETDPN